MMIETQDSEREQTATGGGFSRFDVGVGVVIVVLIIAVIIASYLANPSRRGPMIAYLYPATEGAPNIWLAPLNDPAQAQQITDTAMGIYDFDTSRNGRYIAYSVRDEETRMRDIYVLDLRTGNSQQVTFCGLDDAECYTPAFHPDNQVIAYMRSSVNRALSQVGPGAARIWLTDFVSGEARPLSEDNQLIGHSPQWAGDGNTIAFFSSDLGNPGILVYNFSPQTQDVPTLHFVPAYNGTVGALSPNGRQLVFPDLVNRGEDVFTHLKTVNLLADPPTFENFTDPNDPIDDIGAEWHPDGQTITIERRYTDERWTRGYQLYEVDLETGEIVPLLFDERYSHHFFTWDQTGEHLLMQRLPLLTEDGTINSGARPEVWVLDYETGDLTRISEQAYFPRWVQP